MPGRLRYAPHDRLELELGPHSGQVWFDSPVPVLLGVTVDGRRVTLRELNVTSQVITMPGAAHTVVDVLWAFIGLHASSDAAIRFLSLAARVTHLNEWVGDPAIDLRAAIFPAGGKASWHTPGYAELARVRRSAVGVRSDVVGDQDGRDLAHRLSLEQRSWIVVDPTGRSRHFDDLYSQLDDVRKFLAFVAGSEVELLELRGDATVTGHSNRGRPHRSRETVWVLCQQTAPRDRRHCKASEMLFRHAESASTGHRPLKRWCRRAPFLAPVYNLYLTAQPRKGLYLEFRFLALAQALETLHARLHPGSNLSLRIRLQSLVNDLPSGLRQHVPAHFVGAMVDTRNYLTHWDPKKEQKALHGADLWALVEGAKLLLELTMLTVLGFQKREIETLVRSNRRLVNNIDLSFRRLRCSS